MMPTKLEKLQGLRKVVWNAGHLVVRCVLFSTFATSAGQLVSIIPAIVHYAILAFRHTVCFVSSQDEDIVTVVDEHRAQFGLPGLRDAAKNYDTLLQQQKIETVEALSKVSFYMCLCLPPLFYPHFPPS